INLCFDDFTESLCFRFMLLCNGFLFCLQCAKFGLFCTCRILLFSYKCFAVFVCGVTAPFCICLKSSPSVLSCFGEIVLCLCYCLFVGFNSNENCIFFVSGICESDCLLFGLFASIKSNCHSIIVCSARTSNSRVTDLNRGL